MKKMFFLLYGLVAYLIFFGTFCYAIGFVSTLFVSKHLDSGPQSPLGAALLVDVLLLSLFALQHSVMARPAFKRWWTRFVAEPIERSTYVLLASLCLLLLFWQWQPLPAVVWEVENQVGVVMFQALSALGWLLVLLSTFMINHFDLFGLKQVYDHLKAIKPRPLAFKVTFFYGIVRHPIMLGFLIAFWAAPVMTVGHLLFSGMTTLYILVAVAFLEERDLRHLYGEKYEEYQKRVPMLIPFSKLSVNTPDHQVMAK